MSLSSVSSSLPNTPARSIPSLPKPFPDSDTAPRSIPSLPKPFPDSDNAVNTFAVNTFASRGNEDKKGNNNESGLLKRKRLIPLPENLSPNQQTSSSSLSSFSHDYRHLGNYDSVFNTPAGSNLKNSSSSSNLNNIDNSFCLFRPLSSSSYQQQPHTKIKPQFPVIQCNGRLQGPCRYKDLETIKNATSCSEACKKFCLNAIEIQATKRISQEKTYLTCTLENGEKIEPIVDTASMTGQHCVVASIAPDQPRAVKQVPNERVKFKTFRDHCILVNDAGDDTRISLDALDHVLEQYDQMKENNIPVMEIYNYEQAKSGCGYFFVENVPHPFNMPWTKSAKINELNPDQKKVLDEVRQLFESTYNAHIHADIRPSNLRRRDDGTLVFIDLREDKPDPDEYEEEMKLDFENMLKTFNCNTNDEIYRDLSKNLDFETPWPKE